MLWLGLNPSLQENIAAETAGHEHQHELVDQLRSTLKQAALVTSFASPTVRSTKVIPHTIALPVRLRLGLSFGL